VPLPAAAKSGYTENCPIRRYYDRHAYSGAVQNVMALSLLDGRIEADENLAKVIFACTSCGACDAA
jgi:Fe-S oxidoreductase